MNRAALLETIRQPQVWDVIVIGGGATGLGAAVDAASRGLKTLLLESHDFAKGTSSRATKLVHGGVRYLAQGNFSLVRDALHERGLLRQNATHLVGNVASLFERSPTWVRAETDLCSFASFKVAKNPTFCPGLTHSKKQVWYNRMDASLSVSNFLIRNPLK